MLPDRNQRSSWTTRAEVDPLGRHEREPLAEIEAQLVTEEVESAGAIRSAPRFVAHAGQQVQTVPHRSWLERLPHHSIATPTRSIGTDRSWPVVTQPRAR